MRPQGNEHAVYMAVESGELKIDIHGCIWRLAARRWNRWAGETKLIPCRLRRAENDTGQYLQVRTMFNRKRHHALAHRLVWIHFFGRIPAGMTINHRNGNKKDNRPENLEVASYSEQILHATHVLGHHKKRDSAGRFLG